MIYTEQEMLNLSNLYWSIYKQIPNKELYDSFDLNTLENILIDYKFTLTISSINKETKEFIFKFKFGILCYANSVTYLHNGNKKALLLKDALDKEYKPLYHNVFFLSKNKQLFPFCLKKDFILPNNNYLYIPYDIDFEEITDVLYNIPNYTIITHDNKLIKQYKNSLLCEDLQLNFLLLGKNVRKIGYNISNSIDSDRNTNRMGEGESK
jgi:hypothetical protein